jgi:hypothetical protein
MLLDRCGAQVASQQSPILRNGKIKNTLVFSLVQAIPKGPRLGSHRPTPEGPGHAHDRVVSSSYHAIGAKRKISPHTPASGVVESESTLKPDEPERRASSPRVSATVATYYTTTSDSVEDAVRIARHTGSRRTGHTHVTARSTATKQSQSLAG